MTACLPKTQRPREVGLSPVNRVGIAPNAAGEPMLCYAGSQESLELLSGLPEVEHWREWGCLALPATRTNVLALETLGRIEETTKEYIAFRKEALQPPLGYAGRYPHPPEGTPFAFQHQVEALAAAWHAREQGWQGFGQWAEQGLGKSKWAIDLMRSMGVRRGVLIVQNSTALQWQQNLARLWPECQATLLVGASLEKRAEAIQAVRFPVPHRPAGPQVLVVNWEALARLADDLKRVRPEMVIADEASRIKDRTTQMAKAAHRLADSVPFRVAMSGTPMGNNPGDLWSLYRFIDSRIFGKSYWSFMQKYFRLGGFTGKEFVGFNPENAGELIEKMYCCAHRTTKAAVADLPPKLYETIRLPMRPEQRRLYDQVKQNLYAEWASDKGRKTLTVANVLAQAVRLQQITAGLMPSDDPYAETEQIKSAKTNWLDDYVTEKLQIDDVKIVIWTRFKAELDAVCKALARKGFDGEAFGFIDGSVKPQRRELLRERFNDRSSPLRILVCQVQAAAYGMDIPAADLLIYHSSTFSHLERSQSEDRGHRMGRSRNYRIIDLVCEKSIDETILKALEKKAHLADLLLMRGIPR